MTPQEMSKFGRRITSWLVYFYRNEDEYLKTLTPVITKLWDDFRGIYKIVRVNCDKDAEFCREFMVYSTPKLQIFPSFSGMDAEEFDFHNYLDLIEEKQEKKFLGYLSNKIARTVEEFVIFINSSNVREFSKNKNPKVVLVTNKTKTPVLWKVLSKEFRTYLNFGIVKPSSGKIMEKLKLVKLPTILGYNRNILQASNFKGPLKPQNIR